MSPRALFVAGLLVSTGVALALRLPRLELRPMHVDEAVHASKLDVLWETGRYEYDLNEYHGPTLYYFALPAWWLSGARDFAELRATTLRLVPAIFGVGLVLLTILIADGLGRPATVVAAALAAISPALTYYSRYYIQETLLVFFTFLVIAAGWRYVRTRRVGWALLAGAGVGLMHATKETCVIALGCMAAAATPAALWCRPHGSEQKSQCRRPFPYGALLAGVAAAIVVSVVFFSGFFTNPQGPVDSVRAFGTYFQRAGEGGVHEHPWYTYLHILTYWRAGAGPIWSEGLILALALVGAAGAVRRGASPLLRFLTIYAILVTVVYSAIPYKTPWCILSALHGLILLAGAGAVILLRAARHPVLKSVAAAALVAAGTHLAWQAQRANRFKYCANERNPYVYAATLHAVTDLSEQLERLAAAHPREHRLLIKVMVENCWPLPWYLRGFERVGYWETVPDDPDADVILASSRFEAVLGQRLQGTYQINQRGLRRDERLQVYIEQDVWKTFVRHLQGADAASRPARQE